MKPYWYMLITLGAAAAFWFIYRMGRKLAQWLKPLPGDELRHCPHCGHSFEGTRRYCLACGGQIWEDVWEDKNSH